MRSRQVATRTYTYDNIDQPLTMGDSTGTHTYGYNPRNELTSADAPAGFPFADATFTYDQVGNRSQVSQGGVTFYTPNALNQYTQVGAAAIAHDANGNLTSDGTRAYTYDAENCLLTATGPSLTASYTYDPFGRRLAKTVNGTTTRFLYAGPHILTETDGAGVAQASYVFGPGLDHPLRMVRGGATHYVHADRLGSVIALSTAAGAVAETFRYDAFGRPETPSSLGNPFLFTGREYDQETGLYYYRARYYEPQTGRFLSRDPLRERAGINFYLYVRNNPVKFVDPFGLDAILLNDSNAVNLPGGPYGHNAVAVGNDETGWDYYSQDGPAAGGGHYRHYNTATELVADQRGRYENFYRIPTSLEQDRRMREAAENNLQHPYCANPFSNSRYHCGDFANDALDAGGLSHGDDTFGNVPNEAFEQTKRANPPGNRKCK